MVMMLMSTFAVMVMIVTFMIVVMTIVIVVTDHELVFACRQGVCAGPFKRIFGLEKRGV